MYPFVPAKLNDTPFLEGCSTEFQGEQHYRPVRFGDESFEEAKERFEYTKKHDRIKKKYCIDNNISLIEIPYWKFDDLEYYLFDKFVELHILEEI